MSSPAAGGPATVNGVLYQMLWSLLRAATLYTQEREDAGGAVERATLILEPLRGGGDVQERRGPKRVVEQLKSSASDNTWSLREVIEEVFTDLYVAYDPRIPETEYRFVTEGRMGQWSAVSRFFQELKTRTLLAGDALGSLDNTRALKFHRGRRPAAESADVKPPFWKDGPQTERSIFEKIVEIVRDRRVVRERESIEETRAGIWHLLGNFTLVSGQTMEQVRREIDALLLPIVDSDVTLKEKRQAMLTGLAERATKGSAPVRAEEFFASYGLRSVPLTNWSFLRMKAHEHLDGVLARLGYQPSEDVRTKRATDALAGWDVSKPLLALAGESGSGKSWGLYGLAVAAAVGPEVTILIEATGDAERDCQRAADVFWRNVKGNDGSLPLDRIAARRKEVLHDRAERWLTLLIDNVQSVQELRELVQQPWEEWKVRLALVCSRGMSRTYEVLAGIRGQLCPIEDFNVPELREYLVRRLGNPGDRIPGDVRHTLRHPLLARIYCDLAIPGVWEPRNEYELYRRYWLRLFEAEQGEYPLDTVPLRHLALAVAQGAPYPWTGEQFAVAGLSNEALRRLVGIGWLQASAPDRYRVWHDRLLNWAVAEALIAQVVAGQLDVATLCATIRRLLYTPQVQAGVMLGYVPMDALWLLADPEHNQQAAIDRVIEAMETGR